jgi:hypothetical protein
MDQREKGEAIWPRPFISRAPRDQSFSFLKTVSNEKWG